MKVLTFNIRFTDDKNGNSIEERAPRLKKIIDEIKPDVIGFQECTPKWLSIIEEYWSGEYEIFNKFRKEDNKESTPILWRREGFSCSDKGYFWLSDTPEEESGGWDDCGCYRICTYATLKCLSCGKEFLFINTHFGFGDENQVKSVELTARKNKEISDKPTFITGDFNMKPEFPAYKRMTELYRDVNAETARDFNTTFHNYDLNHTGDHIDYCFIDEGVKPLASKVIYDLVDGGFPSDHYGILFELEIK